MGLPKLLLNGAKEYIEEVEERRIKGEEWNE
jgi:iron uptake system EfeUOB component EfeO/EfeM